VADPILTPEKIALLDDVSDDAYGLWEVDWFFNGHCPTWSAAQRIELLSDIVKHELIDVYFGRLGADLAPLPRASALTAVCNFDNWGPREPLQEPVYYVMASNAGQLARRRSRPE